MHPTNQHYHISEPGIAIVKQFEGLSLKAYKDPVGVWTIGWGTIGKEARPGRTITAAQAERFLRDELVEQENYVKQYVNVPLTQNQFDALTSLVFNVGVGTFKSSPGLKMLNRGNYDLASSLFVKMNRASERDKNGKKTGKMITLPGLVTRRKLEMQLFNQAVPNEAAYVEEEQLAMPEMNDMGVVADGREKQPWGHAFREVLTKSQTFQNVTLTFSGMMMAIIQLGDQIKSNPWLALGLLVAAIGVAGVVYIKVRDTREGR